MGQDPDSGMTKKSCPSILHGPESWQGILHNRRVLAKYSAQSGSPHGDIHHPNMYIPVDCDGNSFATHVAIKTKIGWAQNPSVDLNSVEGIHAQPISVLTPITRTASSR
jgi:hypothetical protein